MGELPYKVVKVQRVVAISVPSAISVFFSENVADYDTPETSGKNKPPLYPKTKKDFQLFLIFRMPAPKLT